MTSLPTRLLIALIAICFTLVFPPQPVRADSASQVLKLLETGWKPSAENFAAAQEQYEQAKREAPGEVRLTYAMALVAIKNQRAEQAAKCFEEALASGKPLLPVRRAHIWFVASRNGVAGAKPAIVNLEHVLTADESQSGRTDYQETSRWLGRVVGFGLEVGKGRPKWDEIEGLDTELSGAFKGALATEYGAGKAAVVKRYAELQEQFDVARKDAAEKGAVQLDEARTQSDADLARATLDRQAAEQQAQQMQSKLESEGPGLQSRGTNLSRQWEGIGAQLRRLQDQQKREESKASKDQNKSLLDSLRGDIDREERDVKNRRGPIEKEITDIRNQLKLNQSNALAARQTAQRLARREQVLTTKNKQLAKQDSNTAASGDPKVATLGSQLHSINTYVSFDLEQDKKLILATFEKK